MAAQMGFIFSNFFSIYSQYNYPYIGQVRIKMKNY